MNRTRHAQVGACAASQEPADEDPRGGSDRLKRHAGSQQHRENGGRQERPDRTCGVAEHSEGGGRSESIDRAVGRHDGPQFLRRQLPGDQRAT